MNVRCKSISMDCLHQSKITKKIKYFIFAFQICKLCYAENIPIIPHGTGTGLEAGISALYGGICLDLTKMNSISDYHPEDFDVCVRPGVTREDLNHHVKDDGRFNCGNS